MSRVRFSGDAQVRLPLASIDKQRSDLNHIGLTGDNRQIGHSASEHVSKFVACELSPQAALAAAIVATERHGRDG